MLIAGALTAIYVLVVCLHFPLNSILKVTLAAVWRGSPLRTKSPTNCGFSTYQANGEQDQSGTTGLCHQQQVLWPPSQRKSVWVREGLETGRAQVPGKTPETPEAGCGWSWSHTGGAYWSLCPLP